MLLYQKQPDSVSVCTSRLGTAEPGLSQETPQHAPGPGSCSAVWLGHSKTQLQTQWWKLTNINLLFYILLGNNQLPRSITEECLKQNWKDENYEKSWGLMFTWRRGHGAAAEVFVLTNQQEVTAASQKNVLHKSTPKTTSCCFKMSCFFFTQDQMWHEWLRFNIHTTLLLSLAEQVNTELALLNIPESSVQRKVSGDNSLVKCRASDCNAYMSKVQSDLL